MGLEWHDRRRDLKGAFSTLPDRNENYNLHLHIRGETYDLLRRMALERRMEMSKLVDALIWRFSAEMGQRVPMVDERGDFDEETSSL